MANVSTLTWLGGDSVDHHDQGKSQKIKMVETYVTLGQGATLDSNPDRINIDSDDDDDTMTKDTPTAPTSDNDFIPLDTTETHPLTTETLENRKRLHTATDDDTRRTGVIIKRRNASLYQSPEDNDTNSSQDVYHDY